MNKVRTARRAAEEVEGDGQATAHRSGAVARMLRMPVATLRIWERRYGLTRAELSPGGQRLYSPDDVRRLALVRQLTELGHAIGTLASLDMPQLQRVASTHASTSAATRTGEHRDAAAPPARAWRLAVIGTALATRLQRPALLRRIGRPVVLLGPFGDAAQASSSLRGVAVDALLIGEPHLHDRWLASFEAAAPSLAALPKAVLYGFAADPVCEALATAGTALLREPQPDAVVAQWLHGLAMAPAAPLPAAARHAAAAAPEPVPPRRWDDAALAHFASRSSTVACECPHHVVELLVQLSHFETYSAACVRGGAADAELHAYLQQVAADSRVRFEAAVERVALHEGLMLPEPPRLDDAAAPNARRARAVAAARARRRT